MISDSSKTVVVVGSGAAGLTAALAAKEAGLEPLVVESMDRVGGSSGMSGGGMWIPNNPLMLRAGVHDSFEEARLYMDTVIGDVGPASSPERRETYLREGPRMVEWLAHLGFRFYYAPGYADYYPELPGGSVQGRCVEPDFFDLNKLGTWKDRVNGALPLAMHTLDGARIALSMRTLPTFLHTANLIGIRSIGSRLLGKSLTGLGGALIGQLLLLVLQRAIPIWLDSPMVELIYNAGKVQGVVVEKEGRRTVVAAKAVILAAGGFAHNHEMRQKYHPHPITTDWTVASPGDLGGAIQAGMAIGAATALMDDAWWGPVFIDHQGRSRFMLWERSFPFGFIVDSSGKRFMNESASYVDCGHWQYERNKVVPAIPAFLIIDARHRKYYPFGTLLPGVTPKAVFESGMMVRANSLPELARACGIDAENLVETARRFNHFAQTGKDLDFHRGESAYDRVYSDPKVKPNPNLGPVEQPPFYAVRVWPGDLGTKGGLLTDQFARVLRENGEPIEGLYAAGNTTASVMGRTYPGPGSTLGPAMVFGMIAGRHAATLG
ncbi:3-oxosteroid 1-dehydrogenase [Thermanaerothrix daxensis]|uniref:3-oxosteroid 1-dehydrogenase n=1 Tax=Thermanaerothrix daxensis TaxID=869279 RepID=A0A0P6YG86_9CHLR|nr:FAD-dependent oxidoreductase [Thermanaerothrix daxensis]KPL83969.1 3-oxosteroid 1-dehydrogenase [Thermanaerothrix daxensis]